VSSEALALFFHSFLHCSRRELSSNEKLVLLLLLLLLVFFLGGGFPIDFTFFVVLQVLDKHYYASHDLGIRAPALFCGVDDAAAPEQKSEGREGGREEGGRKESRKEGR
jgi:hypothetical protein